MLGSFFNRKGSRFQFSEDQGSTDDGCCGIGGQANRLDSLGDFVLDKSLGQQAGKALDHRRSAGQHHGQFLTIERISDRR